MEPPTPVVINLDWDLITANKGRLELIDEINLADLPNGSLPSTLEIRTAAASKLQARSLKDLSKRSIAVLEDLQISVLYEDKLFLFENEREIDRTFQTLFPDLLRPRCWRISRLAGKIKPGSPLSDLTDEILEAAQFGRYPEDQLMAYFQDHPISTEDNIWRSVDKYPKFLEWLLTKLLPDDRELCSLVSRMIERNYAASYVVLRAWMVRTKWQNSGYCLRLRPYLLEKSNLSILDDLRQNFSLDDIEYRTRSSGHLITNYSHPLPNTNGEYYGYREAWHFLEYGPKEQRPLLLAHWLSEDSGFDCSYTAFVNWVNWHQKKEVPLTDNTETNERILALMAEI
jgi:hypothetical protein